ncbi:MAG: hypothetical protein ACYC1Z_08565 [Georgenia sp.]
MSARRTRAAVGATLALVLLAGCAAELPQAEPEPAAATAPPALDETQLDRVLAAVSETLAVADEAGDAEALRPRVVGPALQLRAGEYRLAGATGGEDAPQPLTTTAQVEAVAATEAFPRTAMVVTQVPEGANLPLLLVLVQQAPREQYRLWGWVDLFPGTQTPPLTHPETGSAPLAPDAAGLVATPAEVVERYVDTLGDAESEFSAQFAEDPYKSSTREEVSKTDTAIEAAGDATISFAAGDDAPRALATADGGAIVVGELSSTLTYRKTVAGATLTVGGAIGALLGDDKEVRGTASGVSEVLVAFYVPPATAKDTTIIPLGATSVTTEVTRDDADAPA